MTVKISNLPAATSVGSGDVLPVVQSGTTKKVDLDANWSFGGDVNFDSGTLFVDASADAVGIGTTSPSALLEVRGSTSRIARFRDSGNGIIDINTKGPNNSDPMEISSANRDLVLSVNFNDAMRIDSSGNVGIGTTSPDGSYNRTLEINSGAGSFPQLLLVSPNRGGDLNFAVGSTPIGAIAVDSSAGSNPYMSFRLGNKVEKMRIDSSGRVGIGVTSPAYKLHLGQDLADGQALEMVCRSSNTLAGPARNGAVGTYKNSTLTNPCGFITLQSADGSLNYFWADNSDVFRTSNSITNVGTTSGTVVGTQTSDERIKNIEGVAPYGLTEILQLEPVKYALKSEPDTARLGFTAQQVRDIIPESVFDTDEDMGEGEQTKLGMEYVQIIPVLVNAIKELKAELDELKGA